ncbi:MBL fold metallo-hydrolase [Novosphingobium sp.]|uniref:MBL fold metallo-hydrolase n=1 Tax=Novosphingobium sp. TaxID=1874826 RepID=UPI002734C40B|nr:MBL fold metallo-hydrolase [Novosphingobium sp.]MDP3907184.1 MBL fold metallo-hydrolase [Novosphingobium sp.]
MRGKLGRLFAIGVILIGLFLVLGRDWLADRAFQRALDTSVGVDQSAALPDGLHAYVCGSGSPMPDATRAGPCIAVLAGQQAFIFDAGSGSIRKLLRMGFPIPKAQAAFLTHLHSDHFDGLGELLLQAWVGGSRSAPLPVHGPQGTDQVVGGLMQAYQIDKGYRIAHHGAAIVRPEGFGGAAQIIDLPAGANSAVVHDRDGVRITAIRVDHAPISPALGYRIDYKGRSLAISGDTVFSASFNAAAKGVDVMFHEALNMEMVAALGAKLAERGRKDSAQIMTDIQNYHASPVDAARAAQTAGAKALVLYHLVPPVPVRLIERKFLGDAPAAFDGDLRLAEDGMMISLPAGGKSIDFSNAF